MKLVFALLLATFGIFWGSTFLDAGPIAFESRESKTTAGGPVFNRIELDSGRDQDVWLMQQSDHGFNTIFSKWDRLAILIDKIKKTATFYELAPGELTFEAKPVPYKARCFACHPNGPRAIRWNSRSSTVRPGLIERARLMWWNFKIARYGYLESRPAAEFAEGAPFRSGLAILDRPLGLRSCTKCHSNTRIRSELKLEHAASAHFLVENGEMPPFPFRISAEDRRKLEELNSPL